MKKLIGLLLAIILVTAANSQSSIQKSRYTKEFRFYDDTVKLVIVKTVEVITSTPGAEAGFTKDPRDFDTNTTTVYHYFKVDSLFLIRNYRLKDNDISSNYFGAYKNPNQKIYDTNKTPEEVVAYSNYFLTKNVHTKVFWTMYHSNVKVPYFEIGFDKKTETSVPWIRLLLMLGVIILFSRILAEMFIENPVSTDLTTLGSIIIIAVLLAFSNLIFIGLGYLFIFNNEIYLPFTERVVAWFVRLFLLLILTYVWYRRYVIKQERAEAKRIRDWGHGNA